VDPLFQDDSAIFGATSAGCRSANFGPHELRLNSSGFTLTAVLKFINEPIENEMLLSMTFVSSVTSSAMTAKLPLRVARLASLKRIVIHLANVGNGRLESFVPSLIIEQNVTYRLAIVYDPKQGPSGRFGFSVNGQEVEVFYPQHRMQDTIVGGSFVGANDNTTSVCLNAQIYSIKLFSFPLDANSIDQETVKTRQDVGTTSYAPALSPLTGLLLDQYAQSEMYAASTIMTSQGIILNGTGAGNAATCRGISLKPVSITPNSTGLSIFISFRFDGTPKDNEHLLLLSRGTVFSTSPKFVWLRLYRLGTRNKLALSVNSESIELIYYFTSSFEQDVPYGISIVYNPFAKQLQLWSNGVLLEQQSIHTVWPSMSFIDCTIGKSDNGAHQCLRATIYALQVSNAIQTTVNMPTFGNGTIVSPQAEPAQFPLSLTVAANISVYQPRPLTRSVMPLETQDGLLFNVSASSTSATCPSLDFGPMNLTMGSTGFTLTAIFRFIGSPGRFETIFFGRRAGSELMLVRLYRYMSLPKIVFIVDTPDGQFTLYPSATLAQNEIHRIAFVVDPGFGEFGRVGFWINGTETDFTILSRKPTDRVLGETFLSRTDGSLSSDCLKISLYSLKIFNKPLNQSEVLKHNMFELSAAGYTSLPFLPSPEDPVLGINGSQALYPYDTGNLAPVILPDSFLFDGTGSHKSSTCRNAEFGLPLP
jgi:hypothetical protein